MSGFSHASYTSGVGMNRSRPRTGGVASAPKVDYNKFLADLKAQQDAANAAGEGQYQNLMRVAGSTRTNVGSLFDQQMAQMAGMGATENARIDDSRIKNLAGAEQNRISRGLTNTTIASSEDRGINIDSERAKQDNAERVSMAKAGVLGNRASAEMGLGQFEADSILSKRNVAPDLAMYLQMIQNLGASGGFRY